MTASRANGNGQVFDLEAATRAAADEADMAPFTFGYRGESYTVPPAKAWPLKVNRYLTEGNLDGALGLLLGHDAVETLVEAGITIGDLETLFNQVAERAGLTSLPNSGPPARRATTRT